MHNCHHARAIGLRSVVVNRSTAAAILSSPVSRAPDAAAGQQSPGSGSIGCVFAVGAEHLRTPPYLDGAMVSGTKKFGLSPGRLIVVGNHHLR
jgi:hypothetical protein